MISPFVVMSTAEKGSSRISRGRLCRSVRASASRAGCPPESRTPPLPTAVSSPWGMAATSSVRQDAASQGDAGPSVPSSTFSLTVALSSSGWWPRYPTTEARSASVMSRSSRPPKRMLPV